MHEKMIVLQIINLFLYCISIYFLLFLQHLSNSCLYPDPDPNAEPVPLRLVPEERISFGINAAASSLTTVVQIREDYNEVDCRLIAKEVRAM